MTVSFGVSEQKTKAENISLEAPHGANLHLQRIYSDPSKPAVLCLHGAFDSGRVFYNRKFDRGLAPFLSKYFDVYILDLRGHGKSTPAVGPKSYFGMHENICEDIPIALDEIIARKNRQPVSVVNHSDGSVLFYSALARQGKYSEKIRRIVSIGSKRVICARNLQKLFAIDLVWYRLAPLVVRFVGYLPAKKLKIGSENDTRAFTEQRMKWHKGGEWKDPVDGFDYANAFSMQGKPKGLFIAAKNDPYLGNTSDVKKFMAEVNGPDDQFMLVSKDTGFKHDYDHASIITHRDAKEVFDKVLDWIR